MVLSPRPVPKRKKYRIKRQVAIPLGFVVFLVIYLVGYLLWPKSQEDERLLRVCDWNAKDTEERLNQSFEAILEVNDYFTYGETLSLFNETYDMFSRDLFVGKTIILVNVCTEEERVYMIEQAIDGQIPIEDLQPGFYEVFVMHQLNRHRLVTNEVMDELVTSVVRNGKMTAARLRSDRYLLNASREEEAKLDRHYLFFEVYEEEVDLTADTRPYDIVIDPGHSSRDNGFAEYGWQANGLSEAVENYKMAVALKEEFESYGLKVLILRGEDELVNSYGIDGRLDRAYMSGAKYYLEVQMVGSPNPQLYGTQVAYSSYASSRMPASIFKYLIENTRLESTSNRGSGNIVGVIPSPRADGFDGRMMIRESGGKATTAATFSQLAQEQNSSFALNNRRGLQALTIEYIYLTHPQSAEYWQQEYVEYAKKTVEGYARYLGLSKESSQGD